MKLKAGRRLGWMFRHIGKVAKEPDTIAWEHILSFVVIADTQYSRIDTQKRNSYNRTNLCKKKGMFA